MKNGLTLFRERAGMTKAELARRANTTRAQIGRLETSKRKLTREWADRLAPILGCTPHELMFPDVAQVDLEKFRNVFELADGMDEDRAEPSISLHRELYAQLLPGVATHEIRVVIIEDDDMRKHFTRGDAVVVQITEKRAARPGIYLIDIAGAHQWRFLSLSTAGKISIRADNPDIAEEQAEPGSLKIIGRARLRISTI